MSRPPLVRWLLKPLILLLLAAAAQATDEVPESPEGICPILPGEALPELELTTVLGERWSSTDALAEGPLLLIVYRGGW